MSGRKAETKKKVRMVEEEQAGQELRPEKSNGTNGSGKNKKSTLQEHLIRLEGLSPLFVLRPLSSTPPLIDGINVVGEKSKECNPRRLCAIREQMKLPSPPPSSFSLLSLENRSNANSVDHCDNTSCNCLSTVRFLRNWLVSGYCQ